MLRRVTCCALFTMCSLPALVGWSFGGPPTLEGRVVSLTSGFAIQGVTVTLVGSGRSSTTDASGQFSFGPLSAAESAGALAVTHQDFVPVRIPLGSPPGDGWTLRIQLLPGPVAVGGRAHSTGAGR